MASRLRSNRYGEAIGDLKARHIFLPEISLIEDRLLSPVRYSVNSEKKSLVDTTNHFDSTFKSCPTRKQNRFRSVAGAPGAKVLKAFNNVVTSWIQEVPADMNTVLFVAGDNREAKTKLLEIIRGARFHAVDVGSLKTRWKFIATRGGLNGLLLKITKRYKWM